jgi:hypothetical protein
LRGVFNRITVVVDLVSQGISTGEIALLAGFLALV